MTMNRPNDLRGREIRRVLLAVARRCEARGKRLPSRLRLGLALGISAPQVTRHLHRLRAEGLLEFQNVGQRSYVVSRRIAA
jgi:predicted ArsR family transcriptional regulator